MLTRGVYTDEQARQHAGIIKGYAGGKPTKIDLAGRTVEGIASTINLDRDEEVVLPSAVAKRAREFLASNAPFAAAHTHRTMDASPSQIGWVLDLAVERQIVKATFKFAATAVAEEWWKLASDSAGKGIAFSIGFWPKGWIEGTAAALAAEMPELREVFAAGALADDRRTRVYTDIELIEISAVMAPSNRQSVQLAAIKAFGLDDELVEQLAAKVAERIRAAVPQSEKSDIAELRALIVAQIDEVKSLLPDTVNPPQTSAAPGVEEDGLTRGGGAGPRGGPAVAALEALIADLRKNP